MTTAGPRGGPPTAISHVDLDVVGAILGADKSSVVQYAWDYLRHYEALFAPMRNCDFNLIEIGIKSGISLKLWEWYFPHASIIGIDIDPTCQQFARPRVRIEIGSQADAVFLRRICRAHQPTVFIDDGSHLAHHNIFTFETVFPLMQPGGLYVIEDIGFHFGNDAKRWQGDQPRNIVEYVLDLARACMGNRNVPGTETVAPGLSRLIDSVQFIGAAAIIRRRYTGRQMDRAIETGRAYIDAHASGALGELYFAILISRHRGDLVLARTACERAIAGGEAGALAYVTLGDILLGLGDLAAARAALLQVAAMPKNPLPILQKLAALLDRAGLVLEAVSTLRAVLALVPDNAKARERLAVLTAGG